MLVDAGTLWCCPEGPTRNRGSKSGTQDATHYGGRRATGVGPLLAHRAPLLAPYAHPSGGRGLKAEMPEQSQVTRANKKTVLYRYYCSCSVQKLPCLPRRSPSTDDRHYAPPGGLPARVGLDVSPVLLTVGAVYGCFSWLFSTLLCLSALGNTPPPLHVPFHVAFTLAYTSS